MRQAELQYRMLEKGYLSLTGPLIRKGTNMIIIIYETFFKGGGGQVSIDPPKMNHDINKGVRI